MGGDVLQATGLVPVPQVVPIGLGEFL
jgi:hypothetical protein